MNNISTIALTLTPEEQQQFISYLAKKNKRNDTKNIQLFKNLLDGSLSQNDICFKLYKTHKSNAFHALRKRLYQSLIDFIATKGLEEENSTDMQIIKYILAARKCLLYKQYRIAYKILDKAESLASQHHLFSLLNEIYHTKIQYAHAFPSVALEEIINKYYQNKKNHHLEDQLNMVYAKIREALNNIIYKGNIIDLQSLLNNTLQEHNISLNESMSFKSLYQLMSIVGLSAFVTHDYLKTEPFLVNSYKLILSHKNKEKQLFYHIQILYLIANTLFRNKKFSASMTYLETMHNQMLLQKKKYYNNAKLKYNLLLALNYNFTNKQHLAIELLESLIEKKHADIESLLDIYLSLVMFYFQKSDFKKAQHIFSKFNHSDTWYTEKAGKEWVIKKNLIEILLYIELEHIDLVESRLLSFKRNHFKYLKSINQLRAITYVQLVEHYFKHPENITSKSFKNKVESSFEWIGPQKEDIFVMSFYAWLKSKMEKQDLYHVTLKLVNGMTTTDN
ncbi:hypothetical protein [Aestuariivivens insulae]|uniref:hypothetical protein n=1 Tax=Aestuariivivens insulae TaxID=1621988 RepID=UPI001F576882|nr:hypothetical protein [Aestuariivivens insulae]